MYHLDISSLFAVVIDLFFPLEKCLRDEWYSYARTFSRIYIDLNCDHLWAIHTTEPRWTHFVAARREEDKKPWMELNNMQKH